MSGSLLKNSSIYGVGALLNKALGFLLIPLYTRYFTVAEYGILALLNLTLQLFVFVFLMGVSSAAMRYYFDENLDRGRVYGTATVLLIAGPIVGALVLGPILLPLLDGILPAPLLLVVLLLGVCAPVISLLVGLLRVQERAKTFVLFQIGFFLAQTVLILGAVVVLEKGLAGQLWARFAAHAVFWAVALVMLWRHADLKFSWPIARRLLVFGIPLIPFFIFAWINTSAGRFLLERMASVEEVGIFALAAQFSGLLLLFGNAMDNAMLPHFYKTAKTGQADRPLGVLATRYVAGFGLLAVCTAAAAEPVIQLVAAPEFHGAARYLPFLTLATWLFIAGRPFQWCLTYATRTGLLSGIRGISCLVMIVVLLALLGAGWGIHGVIVATALVNAGLIVAGYFASRRLVPLALEWGNVASIFLVIGGASVALHLLASDTISFGNIALKLLVVAATGVGTVRFSGLRIPRLRLAS